MARFIKLTATAWSNISYRYEDTFELPDDWDDYTNSEKSAYIKDTIEEFLFEDINIDVEILEAEND